MAISYVASSWITGATATVNIPKPTGTVQGDLIIIMATAHAGTVGATGFTSMGTVTGLPKAGLFYKMAGASEGSTFAVTASADFITASIHTYRGALTPVSGKYGINQTGITPSVTTPDDTYWLVFFSCSQSSANRTFTQASYTERQDHSDEGASGDATALASYDSNGTVVAGTYAITVTASGGTDGRASGIVAIAPSAPAFQPRLFLPF